MCPVYTTNLPLFSKGPQEIALRYRTVLIYGKNLCSTRTNTGPRLTLRRVELRSPLNSLTVRLESRSPQLLYPLVTEVITYWKEYFGLEAGTVIVNTLYYQEEDNDV